MRVEMFARYVDGILKGGGKPLAVTWRKRGDLHMRAITIQREMLGTEAIVVADLVDVAQQPMVPRLWDARVIRIERGVLYLRGYESELHKGRLQEWSCEPIDRAST